MPPVTPSSSRFRRLAAIGISLFALLVFFSSAAWSWILRDGLGPESVDSSGIEALRRFLADFWPITMLWGIMVTIAFGCSVRHSSAARFVSADFMLTTRSRCIVNTLLVVTPVLLTPVLSYLSSRYRWIGDLAGYSVAPGLLLLFGSPIVFVAAAIMFVRRSFLCISGTARVAPRHVIAAGVVAMAYGLFVLWTFAGLLQWSRSWQTTGR